MTNNTDQAKKDNIDKDKAQFLFTTIIALIAGIVTFGALIISGVKNFIWRKKRRY